MDGAELHGLLTKILTIGLDARPRGAPLAPPVALGVTGGLIFPCPCLGAAPILGTDIATTRGNGLPRPDVRGPVSLCTGLGPAVTPDPPLAGGMPSGIRGRTVVGGVALGDTENPAPVFGNRGQFSAPKIEYPLYPLYILL